MQSGRTLGLAFSGLALVGVALVGVIAAVLAPADDASAATLRDEDGALVLTWTAPAHQGRGGVSFKEEIKSAAYALQISGRSIEGGAEIDCAARRFQLKRLVVYALAGRRGAAVLQVRDQPDWRTAEPDTTMARVMLAACGPIRAAPKTRADPEPTLTVQPAAASSIQAPPAAATPSPRPPTLAPSAPAAPEPNRDPPDLFVTNPLAAPDGERAPAAAIDQP